MQSDYLEYLRDEKLKGIFAEIKKFNDKTENMDFDIKDRDKSPATLLPCILGFLNMEKKHTGYIIVGAREEEEKHKFLMENINPINQTYLAEFPKKFEMKMLKNPYSEEEIRKIQKPTFF